MERARTLGSLEQSETLCTKYLGKVWHLGHCGDQVVSVIRERSDKLTVIGIALPGCRTRSVSGEVQ